MGFEILQNKHIKSVFCIAAFSLQGCAINPYTEFYQSYVDGKDLGNYSYVLKKGEEPEVLKGDFDKVISIRDSYLRNNYKQIGYSSFNGSKSSSDSAIKQAKKVGATVVLIASEYASTENIQQTLLLPQTSTTNTFGMVGNSTVNLYGTTQSMQQTTLNKTIDRYDQAAAYLVKLKKEPVFGAVVSALDFKQKQEINSNKGVEVKIIIDGSPAYLNDVLEGDILTKANGKELLNPDVAVNILTSFKHGDVVNLEYWRKGEKHIKEITL
ncbi:hypothetical protein AB733_11700 [Photobacterium swingsii]|uniref:Serine protease n=2 Tax=Photobacterium swingsii TaxID=680026 RepID=A0A0J8VB65_9GAMM|nr:hypothetical protein AB733_11700 [Photobacterium swingsii]PSW24494.1 serine protease [Photobacterium swingsii]